MMNKRPYSVPEGYFERMETNLSNIPSAQLKTSNWAKFKPYLALTACFASAYILGMIFIKRPEIPNETPDAEQFYYSDLIPRTNPYFYENEIEEASYDEYDIVDYLIDSGVSVDFINYVLY